MIEKYILDKNILFGEVLIKNEKEELAFLSLKQGNELAEHFADYTILFIVLKGSVRIRFGQELILNEYELVRINANTRHSVDILSDSEILVVKIKHK